MTQFIDDVLGLECNQDIIIGAPGAAVTTVTHIKRRERTRKPISFTIPITGKVALPYQQNINIEGYVARQLQEKLDFILSYPYNESLHLKGFVAYLEKLGLKGSVAQSLEVIHKLEGSVAREYIINQILAGKVRDTVEDYLLYLAILGMIDE